MALPDSGIAWPPKELEPILTKYREYSGWYSNDIATLGEMYGKAGVGRQGVLNRLRTWFLGKRTAEGAESNSIHVSLAQEICRTSANLLYSEPAQATVVPATENGNVEKVQERLDLIAGPDFEQTTIAAAEISAALGGVYYRVSWDTSLVDHAFITKVDSDAAWPEFRWGRLVAVTFWRTVAASQTTIWRHLERHELDTLGNGIILHGLYEGTGTSLGQVVPLTDRPETAGFEVDDQSSISTLTPGLAVAYAPNILPSSMWRNDPVGMNLGRSDLEGIEQKLDALDELYSAWLRDIRLGKGRLIVGESMLRDLGAGLGSGFDLDTTIFTPVKAAPSSAGSEKMALEQVQFDIRTDDFMRAIDHFRRIILNAAGYSAGTFGMQDDGSAVTATEVAAREKLSYGTRKRKILGLKPALETVLSKALAVDAAVFPGKGAAPLPVTLEWPDGISDDPKAVAETNQLDYNSQSSSIKERVRKRNPDWTDELVDAEVDLIKAEFGVGQAEDPAMFGVDGAGLEDSFSPTSGE